MTNPRIRSAIHRTIHGRPVVADSVKRTLIYQTERFQCEACGDRVLGPHFDPDLGLCDDCKAALTQPEDQI